TMPDDLRAEKSYYDVSGCGGNIAWHTENDTIEIADRDVLAADIRVYLLSVLRIANAEVLPFDWRATVSEFGETLARYKTAMGDAFDFLPVEDAVRALDMALECFHADVNDGRIAAGPANATLQGLARILVPVNFTRAARFRHDPAYTAPPLPALA